VKTIVPSSSQAAAPTGMALRQMVSGGPPASDTFSSRSSRLNASHVPSGEKNGGFAPIVPGTGLTCGLSRSRTKIWNVSSR
jgi:hypothetical protein